MATKFTVSYEDGTTETYAVKPRHILAIEKGNKGKGIDSTIEAAYRMAYLASGSEATFDEWIETTADIEPVEEDSSPTKSA